MQKKYYQKTRYCNPDVFHVGNMPSGADIDIARQNAFNAVFFTQFNQLLTYASSDYSVIYNGDSNCKFYCIMPTINTFGTDDKINIAVVGNSWNAQVDGTAAEIKIDGDSVLSYTVDNTVGQPTVGTPPKGKQFFCTNEVAYNVNASGTNPSRYSYFTVEMTNISPGGVVVFTIPRLLQDYADDVTLASQLSSDIFNSGMPLRGADTLYSSGNLGRLCSMQYNAEGRASAISQTQRCAFQYGHPAGITYEGKGLDVPVFYHTDYNEIKIKTRGIKSSNKVDVVVIARADANTNFKIKPASTGTTTSMTLTEATGTTPAVNIMTNVSVAHEDTIEMYVDTYSDNIEIKTVAIFERYTD